MRYLDSGSRDPEHTLQRWLEQRLPTGRYFACQSGYFGRDGLEPFEGPLTDLLRRGGEFHLVVGSNDGGVASADLEYVLTLIDGYNETASLYLVGAADVLMHPKTFYIETTDGVRHALVGSANLTARGLGANIEAALAISSDADPTAPYDEVLGAVLAWAVNPLPNVRRVTRESLAELTAHGATDAPRPPPVESRERITGRRRLFPPLGRIISLPRRPARTREDEAEGERSAALLGSALALPGSAVGLVKELTAFDTKAFRGEGGTAYVALPKELAAYLPMTPAGDNDEPRLDLDLRAQLEAAPGVLAVHTGRSIPNVTYVGMGLRQTSNPDLRLNYLMSIVKQILDAAHTAGVSPPREGDMIGLEFLTSASARLVFATRDPLKVQLRDLVTFQPGSWGWLPSGTLPI